MPAKVVDASVMAAWCFREPRALESFELLKDTELYAPLLLEFELTSIARRKSIANPEKTMALREALQLALTLPIHWNEVDHSSILQLSLEANLTTYDASYLFLALKLDILLATFDDRLERAYKALRPK
jgi:predicted nucleic acid-binding protein